MSKTENQTEAQLLVMLQQGLPIVARPFASIGAELGLSEEDVLVRVRELFSSGVARRFGAIFESSRLGYLSTLCAVDVPTADLEAAAKRIAPHPGITHCYEREGHPNLWFTMTAPTLELDQELKRVSSALVPCDLDQSKCGHELDKKRILTEAHEGHEGKMVAPAAYSPQAPLRALRASVQNLPLGHGDVKLGAYEVLNLPALQKFKIEAVFGRSEQTPAQKKPQQVRPPVSPLSEQERAVVRRLQASIEVDEDPFGVVARDLGMEATELLALLKRWVAEGVIRRIGLVLRHRQLGFSANSMCVWKVQAERVKEAGEILSQSQHVTHCYERPSSAAFPYNLYAMIHAKSREEAIQIFEQLTMDAALAPGRMLWSVHEFKKSSPIFFCESDDRLGKPGPA